MDLKERIAYSIERKLGLKDAGLIGPIKSGCFLDNRLVEPYNFLIFVVDGV